MSSVVRKGNKIFLNAEGLWYEYDLSDPPLGEGAMGVVYKGHSCSTREHVAIKKVRDIYSNNPDIRARAKMEASYQFSHRNLIEIRGYCETNPASGPIFIISKLVQGEVIATYIKKNLAGSMDRTKRICSMMYPVLDALEYLHSKGVLHLDVKPSNIMVEGGHNIRLMDLGIANASENNTTPKGFAGTPKYAAPEQMYDPKIPQQKLTVATDLYQLAITLYELITGNNPYDSSTLEKIIELHKSKPLPYSDAVGKRLMSVLLKATSRWPNNRFQSASEMKEAIQNSLNGPAIPKWIWFVAPAIFAIIVLILIVAL